MVWRIDDPQGFESRKTWWRLIPYTRGKGLDLGCGPEKAFPTRHWIGVDNLKDTGLFGIQMKPDVVADVTDLSMFAAGSMDFVYSSHTLEHIAYEQVPATLREWLRVVRHGGHLVLYLPASGLYPDPGQPGANPDHRWAVTFDALMAAMKQAGGWDLVHYALCDKAMEYSHFFAFKKDKNPNKRAESWRTPKNPQGLKTAGVVRYGAWGDTAQAASVCAQLKKQGYYVKFYGTHPASELIAFDPNIDEIHVQLNDQVPNEWLGHLFVHWRSQHDKFVNLTESVEANLLAVEGNIRFEWAPAARHAAMNLNYLEMQHRLARVPLEYTSKFYPTSEEIAWARRERAKMEKAGIKKTILWGLAGSSRTHKLWPHADAIIGRVLHWYSDWGVVTTGDGSCQDLEKGWEGHPRVWRTAGKWTMRQVCTFLDQHADIVVGPETGLMSVAAFYPMPKLIFLSHSTVENLTRDWVNTTSFWAPHTQCPGRGANEVPACHMMLPKFEPGCRRNEEFGTAQCVAEIKPEWVWTALQTAMMEGVAPRWEPTSILEVSK